jgi:hypothetical protein
VNFTTFLTQLNIVQNAIAITSPITTQVKRSYYGAPPEAMPDLPCIINSLSETERILGFGSREQTVRINVQLLAARATVEDTRSALIATAFWFAAKDRFDANISIGGTVPWSTLRGVEPTVPVILTHGGQAYIGFNAVLEIQDIENFTF